MSNHWKWNILGFVVFKEQTVVGVLAEFVGDIYGGDYYNASSNYEKYIADVHS